MPIKRTLAALVLTLPTGSVGEQGYVYVATLEGKQKRDTKNVPLFLIGIRAEILKYTHVYKLPFVLAKITTILATLSEITVQRRICSCVCLSISVCVWKCTQV